MAADVATEPPATWGRRYLLWAACNAVLGVLLSYPLLLLLIVGQHLRAVLFDRTDSPFQPQEVRYGEAASVIQFTLLVVTPLLVAAVAVNWMLIRRLAIRSRGQRLGMVLLSAAVLTAPAYALGEYLTAGH